MKKFISILLISLCFNFNTVKAAPNVLHNILKEGVYQASTITEALGDIKTVQNISQDSNIYLILLDEDEAIIQTIKMKPKSSKYSLHSLNPNYKIVLVGDGSAFLS